MGDLALVDTNILVYSLNLGSPFHLQAKKFLERELPLRNLALSLQNLAEFFAITTSKKYLPRPLSAAESIKNLEIFAASCQLILPSIRTPNTFLSLLKRFKVSGQEVHDVHLAALMLDNDIETIYTADTRIFTKLDLRAINPLA